MTIPNRRRDDRPAPVTNSTTIPFVDRQPPQNLDAERCVLGAILIDNAVLDRIAEMLKPEDFYRESHETIYKAILKLRDAGTPVDAVTLCDALISQGVFERIGGDEFVGEIANSIPHAKNALHHADIIRQKSITRRSIDVASEVIRRGYSNLHTASQIVEQATREFDSIATAVGAEDKLDGVRDYPPLPGDEVYFGPLGELARRIADHSEASPIAVLTQLITAYGSIIGRGPHFVHESNRHAGNLYCCVVGPTAYGLKGTSWGYAERIGPLIDPTWARRIKTGINSGEVLIDQFTEAVDGGPADNRVLMFESEFVRMLNVFTREGDSLSTVLRVGWDGRELSSRSRSKSVTCPNPHLAVVAHVTPEELNERLSLTQVANGIGNRFLWIWSIKEPKEEVVAFPWRLADPMIHDLRDSLAWMRTVSDLDSLPITLTESAKEYWREIEPRLAQPRPGLMGKLLSRARPYVLRVALDLTMTVLQTRIDTPALMAAEAIFGFNEASVDYVFADRLGDKHAQKVIDALKEAGEAGITQNTLKRCVFGGHVSAAKLAALLNRMVQAGLIHRVVDAKNGRTPVTTWFLGPGGGYARSARSARSEIPPEPEPPKPIF